ncbi:2.A.1.14 the Anion:Cation symporter family [Paxillus involutus ATCC 200175]|uniref:Unplaced genomic scaffold PAXINscaffold_13, whole genome shotgun sequence n=2 Tax=Paxillus involutus ATCC 200175 TaxID=664439 RepID=A0A0C9T0J9_PAXIN|nr:2.A.1.14 the Anion:Cation symporter family [Paxillus involutus ATCC 200175]
MGTKRDSDISTSIAPSDGAEESASDSHEHDLALLDQLTEEKMLLRKLDRRILPITCLLYLFAFLDRSNLGNARLQGLPEDVLGGDPTGVLFDWLVSVFFIPYILCQVPCTVISKYYNPRTWIGCSAILWGLCSTSMSTANNFTTLLVARLFLGVFEAAFGPSVVLYFSFYYTKTEYGTRVAYWFGFAAVASAFGGLLAYAIQHAKVSIANWRLLFIIEGVPTVLLGVVCLFVLPGRPESAEFLTPAERKLAVDRMNRGTGGDVGAIVNHKHVIAAFLDWRVYMAGVIYFGLNCALGSLSAFLPTIIATMGHSSALSQLLTVPPYAVAGLILLIASYTSDRIQSRGLMIAAACTSGGIGYMILLGVTHHQGVRYFATFCVAAGTYASIGLVLAWFAHNLGSETKRATGMPLFGAIGQTGSILGSQLYPLSEGPTYSRGFGTSGGLMFLAALAALVLTISYRLENKRRNEEFGEPDLDERVDTSELADKAPGFRYTP